MKTLLLNMELSYSMNTDVLPDVFKNYDSALELTNLNKHLIKKSAHQRVLANVIARCRLGKLELPLLIQNI